jgi:hypothetical protein
VIVKLTVVLAGRVVCNLLYQAGMNDFSGTREFSFVSCYKTVRRAEADDADMPAAGRVLRPARLTLEFRRATEPVLEVCPPLSTTTRY